MGFGPSPPQLELYDLVKQVYPDAELEYRLGNRRLDIAVPSKRIDWEYDGQYYHSDSNRDEKRDMDIKNSGWRTIRIRKGDLAMLKANPHLLRSL